MLKKKEVCDVVNGTGPKFTNAIQIKKKNKDNVIALKIIQQNINSNLYTNVIGECNLHQLWETF